MDEQAPSEPELEAPSASAISWRASEFEYHTKNAGWYLLFALVFAALVAIAVLTKQWLTVGVFGVMAAALMVYATRRPRDLEYSLDGEGISIDGREHPFGAFQSFAVIHSPHWMGIDLDPVKRFMPRISLPLEDKTAEEVVGVLTAHLPRVDREPDFIERLTRRLKF